LGFLEQTLGLAAFAICLQRLRPIQSFKR